MKQEDLIPKFGEFSDNEPLDIPTMTTDLVKGRGGEGDKKRGESPKEGQ